MIMANLNQIPMNFPGAAYVIMMLSLDVLVVTETCIAGDASGKAL